MFFQFQAQFVVARAKSDTYRGYYTNWNSACNTKCIIKMEKHAITQFFRNEFFVIIACNKYNSPPKITPSSPKKLGTSSSVAIRWRRVHNCV